MTASAGARPYRILVINPNSTAAMTDALQPLVEGMGYTNTAYTFFTSPSGPRSIDSAADCITSTRHALPHLVPLIASHDAFLVACFSPHPLVAALRSEPATATKPVLGILEAAASAALLGLREGQRLGVVSTGRVWERLVGRRVAEMLGAVEAVDLGEYDKYDQYDRHDRHDQDSPHDRPNGSAPFRNHVFAGVETTGLTAVELHETPPEEVRRRVQEATRRLVGSHGEKEKSVGAVVLGCAGMAGMEDWVREVAGPEVAVVDGVRAGIAALQGRLRGGF